MAKKKIYVGLEYRQAFDSIRDLIDGGCFDDLNYHADGQIITDGIYEYELSAKASEEEVEKFCFTDKGATWFKALRGEKTSNNNAIWTAFMENVGLEYHKRFSVVEYKQQKPSKDDIERAERIAQVTANTFTKLFYPLGELDIRKNNSIDANEDIYGISMRVELSGGTGASVPILCKIFFSKDGKIMHPIMSSVAKGIDENMNNIIPDDAESDEISMSDGVVDVALNALDSLIKDNKLNFADYMCMSDSSDDAVVNGLLDKLSHDSMELECSRVDILYITHIRSTVFFYDVKALGRDVFRITVGANDSFSIKCLNCHDSHALVERNEIFYEVDGKKQSVKLDVEREDFGLSKEVIEEIVLYSDIKDHFMHVSCPQNTRNGGCEMFKCKSQVFEVADGEQTVYKCKDCPFPEVVYTSIYGERNYTPNLIFAKDKMDLIQPSEEIEVAKCNLCGRSFTKEHLVKGLCSVCAESRKTEITDKGKKLYRSYKDILSLGMRVFGLFAKKKCVEDDELIVFTIGKKKYIFNKLSLKESGYISKPQRVE